jgi:hypothetical protein
MKYFFIFTMQFILISSLQAQSIKGNIKDESNQPVQGATVTLLHGQDSVVKMEITQPDGSFTFQNITRGSYAVTISTVGHATVRSADFVLDSFVQLLPITLQKASKSLGGIVITAKKPLIQVKADKTIINVEGSVNATGNTVLELLRKSPGVTLDKDDRIGLNGKNGVRVYVDGRPLPLSGDDLAAYLQSLPSSSVEALEIIHNPSARFDAAGNAGIINIRLKKNTAFGTNGSLTAGYNQGVYAKYNGGFSLNYRNARVNLFGNYNYTGGENRTKITIRRTVLDSLFDQQGSIYVTGPNHQFKAGMDYSLNKRSTIGMNFNGNKSTPYITNNSLVAIAYQPAGRVDRFLLADNTWEQQRQSLSFNLNYSYANEKGRTVNVNADHAFYHINGDQFQPNSYVDLNGNLIDRVIYRMISPTDIRITSMNADYEQDLKGGKLGIGGKWASVHSDNDFKRYDVKGGNEILDRERSNRFAYREMIGAGYVNYNKSWKKIIIQGGLRMEHTTSTGRSTGMKSAGASYIPYDSSFSRNYLDLFPSAALTFNGNPNQQWSLSYSRRIDRPVYQDLNPFEFKVDEYTSQRGSVDLKPQYTNSFGITYLYHQKFSTTLNYSHVKDLFVQLMDTIEKSKSFVTSKNLGAQDVISLNMTYPLQYRSYSLVASAGAHYKKFKADFGPGRGLDLRVTGFNFFAQNSLKFGKSWTGELTGFYNSPTIYGSNLRSKGMWSVDAGIQKGLFDGKGLLRFAVSDLFNSLSFEGNAFFAGQHTTFTRKNETRQAKVSFTWRFGKSTVKAARQAKSSAESEMKRVQ